MVQQQIRIRINPHWKQWLLEGEARGKFQRESMRKTINERKGIKNGRAPTRCTTSDCQKVNASRLDRSSQTVPVSFRSGTWCHRHSRARSYLYQPAPRHLTHQSWTGLIIITSTTRWRQRWIRPTTRSITRQLIIRQPWWVQRMVIMIISDPQRAFLCRLNRLLKAIRY